MSDAFCEYVGGLETIDPAKGGAKLTRRSRRLSSGTFLDACQRMNALHCGHGIWLIRVSSATVAKEGTMGPDLYEEIGPSSGLGPTYTNEHGVWNGRPRHAW